MDTLRVAKVENVTLACTTRAPPHTHVHVEGTLHLTPHHLIFRPSAASITPGGRSGSVSSQEPHEPQAEPQEVWIPYPTINNLHRLAQSASGRYPLFVGTKTFDSYTFLFTRDREGGAEDVWQSVKDCAVAQSVEQLYAFFYTLPRSPVASTSKALPAPGTPSTTTENPLGAASPSSPQSPPAAAVSSPPVNGWAAYNPRTEFARQGVGSRTKAWRFTDINRDYAFSPTYPAKLVVPTRISDPLLTYASKYRSKARIPSLSYLHWANHATITRSSQPMIGLKNTRSPQDERLVECIFTSHLSSESALSTSSSSGAGASTPPTHIYGATPTNLIIDARPTANAMANRAKGAGTENMDWYKGCKKEHLGIDNIHVMRNSLKHIAEVLAEAEASQMPVDRERLRRSGWLKHIGAIMDGSVTIIKNVHVYSSHVLIHCSDGWDRTSQLSAIAQLCLDPYFRTLDGFKVLVEKDWLSFGHMFLQRSGHLSSGKLFTATPEDLDAEEESDDDFGGAIKGAQAFFASVTKTFASNSHLKEISPVFHQFLDCVRQIQRQFPERFEFNEDYLLDMHYHLYACQFGTFLFDSERQRRVPTGGKPYVDRTTSAWDYFDLPTQRHRYVNPDFDASLDDRNSREPHADLGVLIPDAKDIKFWHRLFKRSDDDMNAPVVVSRFLAPETSTPSEPEEVDSAEPSRQASPMPGAAATATATAAPAVAPAPVRQSSLTAATIAADPLSTPPSAAIVSSPFSRFPGIANKPPVAASQGGPGGGSAGGAGSGWNWSQLGNGLSSGAMTAFNQIRTSATDAITQLRENADDEMWGKPQGGSAASGSYAPGTGIGEGGARPQGGALPRQTLRMPSESNPWSVESPSAILGAEGGPPGSAESFASRAPAAQAAQAAQAAVTPSPVPTPRRENSSGSWAHVSSNPWGDAPVSRSLADLSLEDVAGKRDAGVKSAAPAAVGAIEVEVTKVTKATTVAEVRVAAEKPAVGKSQAEDTDAALLEAALGGDSKAWDPLGAL